MALKNKKPLKTISTKKIYHSPWLDVREDKIIKPDGRAGKYVVVERPNCSVVIPQTKNSDIYLAKEFRYPIQQWSWNFNMGSWKQGETAKKCAARELEEETGFKPGKLFLIGKFNLAPGYSIEKAYVYLARDLKPGKMKRGSCESIMQIKKFSIQQIDKMIKTGKIEDSLTIIAWYFFKEFLNQNK